MHLKNRSTEEIISNYQYFDGFLEDKVVDTTNNKLNDKHHLFNASFLK